MLLNQNYQDGFYVSPGGEKLIAIVPEVLNTTEAALKLTIKDRDCYQDSVSINITKCWQLLDM